MTEVRRSTSGLGCRCSEGEDDIQLGPAAAQLEQIRGLGFLPAAGALRSVLRDVRAHPVPYVYASGHQKGLLEGQTMIECIDINVEPTLSANGVN